MLQFLNIQNFALINQLDLEFESGMTVLTGETGAGKSIIIDALLLALGGRADSQTIHPNAERCTVSASFNIKTLPHAQQWLQQRELGNDEHCILRRTLTTDGRSRGFINDQPVPLQVMRELGDLLVSIHGQHEHQALLKPDQQRILFDDYAGHSALVDKVFVLYESYHETQKQLAAINEQHAQRNARLELLRYQVNELKQLDLQEDELARLDQEQYQLANAEALLTQAQQALDLLEENDNGGARQLLTKAQTILAPKIGTQKQLESITQLLNTAIIQTEEATNELRDYCEQVQLDPERLQWVEQRLEAIHDLARKHRINPENLFATQQKLEQELQQLTHSDTHTQELQTLCHELQQQYQQAAKELTRSRQKAEKRLVPAVTQVLHQLGMPGGKFDVTLTPLSNDSISPYGLERIEFLVSANPGQPLQPLAKVASGGELSRISLAIHALTTQNTAIPTLIFDEVDVGIGGGTAEIVGRLLQQLSTSSQLLCVTHLPQVAALGRHHFQVNKKIIKNNTQTEILLLNKNARIQEIARMLGGIKITAQTLAHAKEMVEVA